MMLRKVADEPARPAPSEDYVCRILDRLATTPEREVIMHGDRWLSGGKLRRLIGGAVCGLSRLGVGRDGTVAALTEPNHPLMLVIRYAANLLGARIVYVRSVNPRSEDVGLTDAQRVEILRETHADLLFADRLSLPEALALRERCGRAIPVCGFDLDGASEVESLTPTDDFSPVELSEWNAERVAAVVYTSGTAGVPKGVCISFGAWDSMVRGFARSQSRPLTFLAVTPISQAASTMLDGCLTVGGRVVLHPGFDADAVLDSIAGDGVTGAYMAMPHLYALLDNPRIAETDLSRLVWLIYSGTPASRQRMERASRVFGMSLIQSYGTTEAGPVSVLLPMAHRSPDLRRTVGRPLPGVRIRICDPQTERDLDAGAIGEVWVRSPTTMSGYLGDQPAGHTVTEDGWLRTGDLGTFDSRGYLSLLGRLGDVIKCRGIKVFPQAVEEALISHLDVAEAHVFGLRGADEIEEVHAAVALRPDADVCGVELRDHVAACLSPLHVPDAITRWSALPLTAVGKPDRRLLALGAQGGADEIWPSSRPSGTPAAVEDPPNVSGVEK